MPTIVPVADCAGRALAGLLARRARTCSLNRRPAMLSVASTRTCPLCTTAIITAPGEKCGLERARRAGAIRTHHLRHPPPAAKPWDFSVSFPPSGQLTSEASRSIPTLPNSPASRCGSARSSGCCEPGSVFRNLSPLDTIECREAILAPDGSEPSWPESDVVIGNPPFLGGKLSVRSLGEDYVSKMFKAYSGRVSAEADLVTYWLVNRCALESSRCLGHGERLPSRAR